MPHRLMVSGAATTAEDALTLHRHLFREPGEYLIAKAETVASPFESFEAWFLEQLAARTREHFVSAELAIWEVLDKSLAEHGVAAPSELALWELHRDLFDLTAASTARMVGFHVPPPVAERLQAMGFTLPETLDFPALAWRMGRIYQRLMETAPLNWPELRQLVTSYPLTPVEEAAIAVARAKAGLWLKPIFDAAGHVWTADREIAPLREQLGAALEGRKGVFAAARELGNSQRAMGVLRDAERVARTEIADARAHGAWSHESQQWNADTLVFRQTSQTACRDCFRLYKLADGMPRLYKRSELEALDAQGPNQGPRESWRPRIGATHPNCACAPWQAYLAQMQRMHARRAPEFAALMKRLRVFEEAA